MSNVKLFFWLFLPITIETKDYYVAKGSNITLICPFKKGSTGTLQWTYINASQISWIYSINADVNTESLPSELYSRLSVTGDYAIGEYNLQIRDIRETDEGRYSCINTATAQQDEQRLYLIVPLSSVSIENVAATQKLLGTEGQDLTVTCVAVGGKPPPNVTLKVDGTSLAIGYQSVTYTLKSISRSYDRKTVTCQAYNEANVNLSNDSAMFYLNLKPSQPIFSPDPVSTEETRSLVVSCTSTGSRPQATFLWMIGQAAISSSITTTPVYNTADDTYTVTSTLTYTVDRTNNGQTVTCRAYNNVFSSGVVASTTLDVKCQPIFTNGNTDAQYGEFGKDVDIYVYVYSVPKYTSIKWYKINTEIVKDNKYCISELTALVHDTFHGAVVQLDGYRVTLTIKNLVKSDFNVTYKVEMSNGVGQTVGYTVLLVSVSTPQTPLNFTVLSSTESSIVVQWKAGYNGGHEQTFYLQFRRLGSISWVSVKIPEIKEVAIQTFTLSELKDDILFELMMYADNIFKKSLPTETRTIATIKDSRLSSAETVIRGVAGGLSGVIFIMFIIIIAHLVLRKNGTNRRKSKAGYPRWKENMVQMDGTQSDENTKTDKRDKHNKTTTGSAKEYETLGLKDNPNTYSKILTSITQGQKQSEKSTQEYETYSQQAQLNSEYTNIKI